VAGASLQRKHNARIAGQAGVSRIAQPDRDIAQPAFVADAADCAALQPLVEFLLGPGKQLGQRSAVQAVAHIEVRQACALRELVPRADQLAVIAAQHPVAYQRP
jgi:hypothetical protein